MNKAERIKRHQEIRRLYFLGYTPKEITSILKADYISVLRILKKYNLKLEGSGGKNRKITTNFLEPTNDKNYYFIGYIASDGNIYKTQISLYSTDVEYLESFKNTYKQDFGYYYYRSSAGTPMIMLHFGNKKIVEYLLKEYNLTPNKSKTLQLNILNWSILRGIFDGDGSAKKEIKITTGSKYFKDQLINFLQISNIDCYYRTKGKNKDCYDILIKSTSHADFAFKLYHKAELYLERKYKDMCALLSKDNKEKWDKLLETYGEI